VLNPNSRYRPLPAGAWCRLTKWPFKTLVVGKLMVTDHKMVMLERDLNSSGCIAPRTIHAAISVAEMRGNFSGNVRSNVNCDCQLIDRDRQALRRGRSVLAQPGVELRPRMTVPAMRAERLCHRVRNKLETLFVGFDTGREFPARDRAFDQQYAHTAPSAGPRAVRATPIHCGLYEAERPNQGRAQVPPQWLTDRRHKHAQKSVASRHQETVRLAPASRVIASIIAAGLATPLPAMSNALPCATEENRIGLPIAKAATG